MNLRRRIAVVSAVIIVAGLLSSPHLLFGSNQSGAKELIEQSCVQCHRIEGTADSRFHLKAPDLIWAGSKYQRP